jgi:hypothetical protein
MLQWYSTGMARPDELEKFLAAEQARVSKKSK